jgi:hypothetical protein
MFYRMQYKPASFFGTALPVNSLQTAVRDQSTPLTAVPAGIMATGDTPSKPANQGSSLTPYENDKTTRADPGTGSDIFRPLRKARSDSIDSWFFLAYRVAGDL